MISPDEEFISVALNRLKQSMRLHHLVVGSTGPGYSLFRFTKQEKIKLAKTKHLSSGISAAI